MEMGIERPFPRLPHSQLPHARCQGRHTAGEFRRAYPGAQALRVGRIRVRDSQDRGLYSALSRQPEIRGRNQLVHPVRLDRLGQTPGDRHGSRCPAAPGPREHGLLQSAADHTRRQHPQLHRYRGRPAYPIRRPAREHVLRHAFRCRSLGGRRPGPDHHPHGQSGELLRE